MQVLLPDWSVRDTEEHLEPLFCNLGEAVARREVAAEAAEAAEVHGVPADVVLAGPSAQHGAPGQGGDSSGDSNGGDSTAAKYGKGDSTAAKYGKGDSAAAKYGKCDSTARYGKGDAALPPRLLRGYPPAALARVLRLFGLTIGWYADGL